MVHPKQVPGAQTGIQFPTSIEALQEAGPEFLTRAFRAAGALLRTERVAEITGFKEFFGGGAGRKLELDVRYVSHEGRLHTKLFVKYPRDFDDPLRSLFSHLMEAEVKLALLSREDDFPVAVPKCYFADFDPQTSTGLLITERIQFAQGDVEPFYDKCLDYTLPQPLQHYQALIRAVARLSGAHKAGKLGAQAERLFPFSPAGMRDRIPYDAKALQAKIDYMKAFMQRNPGLFPEELRDVEFLSRFGADALRFLALELPIKEFLGESPDFIALSHWNANVDNAWFWHTGEGQLNAGLLDWGGAGQMNIAQAIYGVLCAVETSFWKDHKNELVLLFAEEYERAGGPRIDPAELKFHLDLFIAMLGLAWMIDAPAIIESQIPDLNLVEDRFDPKILNNFLARAQLHLLVVFLNAWLVDDFGSTLRRFSSR